MNIALFLLQIPLEDQENCFTDPAKDTCNVILATNIAESSVTLPEISVIIDFGQRRHVVYDNKKRMSLLQLDWCSQASMNQRKGIWPCQESLRPIKIPPGDFFYFFHIFFCPIVWKMVSLTRLTLYWI